MERLNQQAPLSIFGRQKNLTIKVAIICALVLVLATLAVVFWSQNNIKSGTATLSWEANSEPDLAGYKIYYGVSPRTDTCPPGGYPEKIDIGKTATPDKPSYKINNLQNGKTYYFSITSYDTFGNESCFSEEGKKTISRLSKINWLKSFLKFK